MQNVESLFRFSGDRRHLELMCDHAQSEFDSLASPALHYTDVNHCLSQCPPTSQPTWDSSTWTPIFHTVSLGQDLPRGCIQLPGRKLQRVMVDERALWAQGKFCARTFQRLFQWSKTAPRVQNRHLNGCELFYFPFYNRNFVKPCLKHWAMTNAPCCGMVQEAKTGDCPLKMMVGCMITRPWSSRFMLQISQESACCPHLIYS